MATITLDLGDYTGMKNKCTEMNFIDELLPTTKKDDPENVKLPKKLCSKNKTPKKEFPPSIPLLAQTENLRAHMPWVLRRNYTSDGRLVLYTEKVRHHEYFKVHRENGRLTLQLVPMDIDCIPGYSPDEGDEEEGNPGDHVDDDDADEEDGM